MQVLAVSHTWPSLPLLFRPLLRLLSYNFTNQCSFKDHRALSSVTCFKQLRLLGLPHLVDPKEITMAIDGARPPFPPFTEESARAKVKAAEDAWNSRNPDVVALAYTEDSEWRNRTEFFKGREAIKEFLTRKWAQEHDYRLMKELWAFTGNHIAVRFEYEWHNDAGQWFRTHGNELWEFEENGLMRRRDMSANDVPINESDRRHFAPAAA